MTIGFCISRCEKPYQEFVHSEEKGALENTPAQKAALRSSESAEFNYRLAQASGNPERLRKAQARLVVTHKRLKALHLIA